MGIGVCNRLTYVCGPLHGVILTDTVNGIAIKAVHRSIYGDQVVVKATNTQGDVIFECWVVGTDADAVFKVACAWAITGDRLHIPF